MKRTLTIIIIFLIIGEALSQNSGLPVIVKPHKASSSPGIKIEGTPIPPVSSGTGIFREPINNPYYSRTSRDILRENDREIAEIIQRQTLALSFASNGFPSQKGLPGTEYFYSAFQKISAMLSDSLPLNLGEAVFLVENAMLGNKLDYSVYQKEIDKRTDLCRLIMQQEKLSQSDNLAKNNVLYRLFTQTITVRQPGTEKIITHYPVQYNLEDYRSEQDFTSHFITTLLATNKGQCYSMPLLYLIVAEKLGAEAYLSYAPKHSMVKIKDNKGRWYNLELTCRYIMSDNHYINSGLIKSQAIRSGLYLSPMNKKEVIASLMIQLGNYYSLKYGYDPFVIKCLHLAEKQMNVPVEAWKLEADYHNRLLLSIMNLLQIHDIEQLKTSLPQAYARYEKLLDLEQKIQASGYEELSPVLYQKMLEHVEKLKEEERLHPQSPIKEITR